MESEISKRFAIAEIRNRLLVFEERRLLHFKPSLACHVRKPFRVLFKAVAKIITQSLLRLVQFLLFEAWPDLILHLVQRLQVRRLVVQDFNNMNSIYGLDQITHLAGLHAESCIFKFLHRLAADDPTDVPALLRTRILGILPGQLAKIFAGLDLVQNITRGIFNCGDLCRSLARRLEQDVGRVDTVGDAIIRKVLVIVLLDFIVAYFCLIAEVVRVDEDVAGAAFFRHFVSCDVFLIEGIQGLRSYIHRLDILAGIEEDILNPGLGITLDEFCAHLRGRYLHAISNDFLHFLRYNAFAKLVLKLPCRHACRLFELIRTNEDTIIVEPRNGLRGLQHLLRRCFDAEFMRLK